MPLSDEEQRLLDEMERSFYKNQADIVQTHSGPRTVNYTRVALGILGMVVGLGLVVVGVATQLIVVGVIGFGVAVAGALVALSSSKPAAQTQEAASKQPKARAGGGLMDKLNQEWDKRDRK